LVDYNQLEIEPKMFLKRLYGKTKLPFELSFPPLPFLPFFDDATSQRVPNVPSGFLSIKHRCLGPQSIG
jgi:hypothetical protein